MGTDFESLKSLARFAMGITAVAFLVALVVAVASAQNLIFDSTDGCTSYNPTTADSSPIDQISGQIFTIDEGNGTIYNVGICTPVACNDKDGNIVGGCQQYQQGGDTHERVLGQTALTTLNIDTDHDPAADVLLLKYMNGDGCSNGENRTTLIYLVCDLSFTMPEMTFLGEPPPCGYEFEVRTAAGPCPVANTNFNRGGGVSGGGIFCILVFVATVLYLGIGVGSKYTVQGARGTEAIPNIDFWWTVKMHIADGVRYTTS